MKLDSLLFYVKVAAFITAIVLLLFKFIDAQRYKAKNNRPMKPRWFTWYSSVEVVGSSSNVRRAIMERSNIITTIIWVCAAIIIATSLVPTP